MLFQKKLTCFGFLLSLKAINQSKKFVVAVIPPQIYKTKRRMRYEKTALYYFNGYLCRPVWRMQHKQPTGTLAEQKDLRRGCSFDGAGSEAASGRMGLCRGTLPGLLLPVL